MRIDIESGFSSPVCLFAELPLPHIINGTEAELIGARRDQAIDRHCCGHRLNIGLQDGPGSIWKKENQVFFTPRSTHTHVLFISMLNHSP